MRNALAAAEASAAKHQQLGEWMQAEVSTLEDAMQAVKAEAEAEQRELVQVVSEAAERSREAALATIEKTRTEQDRAAVRWKHENSELKERLRSTLREMEQATQDQVQELTLANEVLEEERDRALRMHTSEVEAHLGTQVGNSCAMDARVSVASVCVCGVVWCV